MTQHHSKINSAIALYEALGIHSSDIEDQAGGGDFFCLTQGTEVANTQPRKLLIDTPNTPLTTEKFAQAINLQPQSIRKRYAQTGSYFGVVPSKLPNGRLRWPLDSVQQLVMRRDGK